MRLVIAFGLNGSKVLKIVVVGAFGTIGKAVSTALDSEHEVIQVGRSQGTYQVDMADESQVARLFEQIGAFDALISTAGAVHFDQLTAFDRDKWQVGLQSKLLGQVNLVMQAIDYINAGGSFTLTSGVLNRQPDSIWYFCSDGQCSNRRLCDRRGN